MSDSLQRERLVRAIEDRVVRDPRVSAIADTGWRSASGEEHYREPVADRVRSDPLDAKTSRHEGECEFASATDAAVVRLLLKVKDGAGGGYWWVECSACDCGWQVPYYAGENLG